MNYDDALGRQPETAPMGEPDEDEKDRRFEARYGKLIVGRGIATFPSLLLRWQRDLQLENEHLLTLLVIFSFYRTAGSWPSVSIQKMAAWRGASWESVERTLDELQEKGYLHRPGRDAKHGGSYFYDLSSLITTLDNLARAEEKTDVLRRRDRELRRGIRGEALRKRSTEDETNRDQ